MRIISLEECEAWVRGALSIEFSWENVSREFPYQIAYSTPPESGRNTVLARSIMGHIEFQQTALFWVTDWSIFPSAQNMLLFDGYRESLGERRPIHAAPGHLFDPSDSQKIECLLDLALYFYWDTGLFCPQRGVAVETSHDRYFSVYAKDKAAVTELEEFLPRLELQRLGDAGY